MSHLTSHIGINSAAGRSVNDYLNQVTGLSDNTESDSHTELLVGSTDVSVQGSHSVSTSSDIKGGVNR
ncbi:hypothetical protein JQC92_00190 [Shewanella sp. 202IG2-18]|uniref:hypothetical protein n=1 Tax=Parashewanella hymeniacidonis TaxID=2807618 RepID=UPI00196064EA|nr:hypothetical protein [Parashewanella hymeniacidonis]MBM7070473.1 hypothetical protein [Parashewanella hymeniacidonis]